VHLPPRLLVVHEGLRPPLKENYMDYLVAGAASLGLFVYLLFALLRPEKF
jgi:K+-transporting ATPase KdpF subunit